MVPRPDTEPDEAEMIAYTLARLARYKCPTSIRFVDRLPQTASGKILKKDLRAMDRALSEGAG